MDTARISEKFCLFTASRADMPTGGEARSMDHWGCERVSILPYRGQHPRDCGRDQPQRRCRTRTTGRDQPQDDRENPVMAFDPRRHLCVRG